MQPSDIPTCVCGFSFQDALDPEDGFAHKDGRVLCSEECHDHYDADLKPVDDEAPAMFGCPLVLR